MDKNRLKPTISSSWNKPRTSGASSKTNRGKKMVNYFRKTVRNSYHEVCQHEKFRLNIHSFKRELNTTY
jgi:hypothetical protein